ncbi:hybrid sensor histidine kinase/response regulator [Rubinisphaera margarita]|uniref:hybrid sensor histidine kinase/response regulator n=1 Tax=Rubinisphaera margarita TaxID=2909586 RepID=UPI001EE81757|nr:PAS domain S-box protein [Rubinisphaera margarita]MCG6158152.1 PAS domain S-box protein [Rubinisphaera margarita]
MTNTRKLWLIAGILIAALVLTIVPVWFWLGSLQDQMTSTRPDRDVVLWTARAILVALAGLLAVGLLTVIGIFVIGRRVGRTEETLRITLTSIGDAVITTDAEGQVTYLNPVAAALTGWTTADAAGVPLTQVFEIVNESTRAEVKNPALRALQEGVVVGLANHTILIARDGTERFIDDSAAPIRDTDENIVGSVLIFRDISERRRIERQMEDARIYAECIVDTVREPLVVLNGDLRVWTANRSFYQTFRVTSEETERCRLYELGNGQWNIPQLRSLLEEILPQNSVVENYEVVHDFPDIGRRTMLLNARKLYRAGNHTELVLLAIEDITERQQGQESLRRLASLVESSDDAIISKSLDGTIQTWNAAAERIFGYTAEQVIGRPVSILIPEERASEAKQIMDQLRSGHHVEHYETVRVKSDGQRIHVSLTISPIKDDSGQVIGASKIVRDVTGRRDAETALKEARSRLESTLAAAEIGTWEFDPICNAVRADVNLAHMFGVAYEGEAAESLELYLAAIHPEDRERVTSAIEEALAGKDTYEAEYRIVGANENIRWVVARGRVERDASGQAVRMPGVVVDITGRKQAEAELRASEQQRRLALDAAELGSWNIDPATNELVSDDRFRMMFHGSTDPLTYEEAFARLHPDDRPRIRDAMAAATNPDDPVPYAEEYRVIHPDGQIRWVFGWGRGNFDPAQKDRLVSFDGTVMDITERKRIQDALREQELRFRMLVEQVEDYAIFVTDAEGRATTWNEGVLRVLGFTEEEFIGVDIVSSIFRPEDVENGVAQAELAEAAETGSASDDRWMRRKDGTHFWAAGVTTGLHDENGKLLGFMKVMRDQTERKQMEDDLREFAAELSDADRRKTEFLATLGHELRNPLAPIRTGLEAMKLLDDDPDALAEIRSTMERQVQQMVRLIDDLLDVSRITQNKMELRKCRVALNDVVRSAVEATKPFVDEAGHELTVTLSSTPIFLDADPNRLAQIFSNLLNNSTKYTPDGGHIWLTVEGDGSDVIVTVKDNGLGIPTEMQDRIFEMFTQIDRPQEKSYTGLGIGLTLVKRLVEMHNGSIAIRSDGPGRGSEFSVRLPVLSDAFGGHSSETETAARANPLRILVVDDNKAAASMLRMVVKMLGNDVRLAHDGQQAVDVAEEFLPDVVLMDLGMPRMNGYEAARIIREKSWGKDILLVALTGWGQDEDRERSQAAGFDHHLVKPAEPAAVQLLLANHQPRMA